MDCCDGCRSSSCPQLLPGVQWTALFLQGLRFTTRPVLLVIVTSLLSLMCWQTHLEPVTKAVPMEWFTLNPFSPSHGRCGGSLALGPWLPGLLRTPAHKREDKAGRGDQPLPCAGLWAQAKL
jgi:hypothetical protein